MLKARIRYLVLIFAIIIAGLLSRKFAIIPLWVGDVLWAAMIFFMVRFFYVGSSIKRIAIISLIICYAIEFSQLYKAEWIDKLRHTLFGKLVLGDTFLWGDLLSYTIGIGLGIFVEVTLNRNRTLKC
jgi:hypothetical protein